jgi:hypothetical protein
MILGAIGPLLLTPVVVWLDSHPHDFRLDMSWEPIFRWLWPTSPMLMTGGGARPFSLSYLVLIGLTAIANIVVFGLSGALLGSGLLLAKSVNRTMTRRN